MSPVDRFEPFPITALPEPMQGFVGNGARAIGCDPSYLALPLLSASAAAIGNTRRIQLKRGWTAPAIIWTAVVGESGTSKTPAFKLVMKPLRVRQHKLLELFEESRKQFEEELLYYDKEHAAWKQAKRTQGAPPAKPEPPGLCRCFVSDTTVEALAPILLSNPRGVLLARDELAGWIGSFDRYSSGKSGADSAHWLSMHNGESVVVDRKTGKSPTIFVPQATVSVTGGIQPTILHRALGKEHRESGLAARLLVACPPRKSKKWTEADIAPEAEVELASLFERLFELQPILGEEGKPLPVVLELTRGAKAVWKEFYNLHAEEQINLSGELSAAWSKLEEYAARLALVLHCCRCAGNNWAPEKSELVDEDSMKSGIELAQWFKNEARRVYALLSESEDERSLRQLVEWIDRKGGVVTAREVQQGNRRFTRIQDADSALVELVKAGMGKWVNSISGNRGQPTRRFPRPESSAVYGNTKDPRNNCNTVDVDGVDMPETPTCDDWAEL